MSKAKYEVVRAWANAALGEIVELKEPVHPSLAANVRKVGKLAKASSDDGAEASRVLEKANAEAEKIVQAAKATAAEVLEAAKAEAEKIVEAAKADATPPPPPPPPAGKK